MEDSDSQGDIDTLAGTMAGFGVRKVFIKTSSVFDDFMSQSSKPFSLPMKRMKRLRKSVSIHRERPIHQDGYQELDRK